MSILVGTMAAGQHGAGEVGKNFFYLLIRRYQSGEGEGERERERERERQRQRQRQRQNEHWV